MLVLGLPSALESEPQLVLELGLPSVLELELPLVLELVRA